MSDGPETIVAEIEKNARERIRVTLDTYRGHRLVGFRVWVPNGDTEVPTKAGIVMRVDLVDELIAALEAARTEAIMRGWLELGEPPRAANAS